MSEINNDALGIVLSHLNPEDIFRLRSVNRQWNKVGKHVLGYSDHCPLAVAEKELIELKKKEKQLKRKIDELYLKRAEQHTQNIKWQKHQILQLANEFNIHFGPSEGHIDPQWVWEGVTFRKYQITFDHTQQCPTKTPLEGNNCYCPIKWFDFGFQADVAGIGTGTSFSIEYTATRGWTGIDPELTVKDFDKNSKCAPVKPKYSPDRVWGGSTLTHIIEHITQRVINHRIAWRRQMEKLVILDVPDEEKEEEQYNLRRRMFGGGVAHGVVDDVLLIG